MIFLVILVLVFTFIAMLIMLIDKYNVFWYISTCLSLAAGVLIFGAAAESMTTLLIVIVAIAVAFSVLPTTKAYFVKYYFSSHQSH